MINPTIEAWKWGVADAMNRLYQAQKDLSGAYRVCPDQAMQSLLTHHREVVSTIIQALRVMSK